MDNATFTDKVKMVIKRIPAGKVATYGQVAMLAGNYRGARQVAWVLHSSSKKDELPWQRVINGKGEISLPKGGCFEEQKALLQGEGIQFDNRNRIDLNVFLWNPEDSVL